MPSLIQKLPGYQRRLRHEWAMWRARVEEERRGRAFEMWRKEFGRSRADVIVGSNFVEFGGCRHHMHAIEKFSSLRVELAPTDGVLATVPAGYFGGEYREAFLETPPPPGLRAVHSHVFPWLIDWAHRHHEQGFRWVHTHHNWYYPEFTREGEPLEPWQEALNETFLFALRHCDVALSVSKWQRDFLQREHGIESLYLPNGVDVSACDRGRAERFRKRHPITGPFLLWAGRNDPVKNPADFVRLALAMPEQLFVMLGPDLDSERMLTDWQVESPPNLRYLGSASHTEVQDALSACSALVVTSFREGLPTLVLEAMAQARPVVAIEEDGSAEALGDGDFGYLAPRGDVSALAETVLSAQTQLHKPRLARARVLEEYDWRVVAQKLDAIYRTPSIPAFRWGGFERDEKGIPYQLPAPTIQDDELVEHVVPTGVGALDFKSLGTRLESKFFPHRPAGPEIEELVDDAILGIKKGITQEWG